jgi:hypothetical protein
MHHLDLELLKRLMLTGSELTEDEERHLFHCPDCLHAMADVTIRHLQEEPVRESFE